MTPQTENQRVKWGILGCAGVADSVMAPGIRRARNATILAVASRRLKRAQEFAEKFDIDRAYGSYGELLDDTDVQAVYIPLPNSLHREWTIAAAERGKHVLCEKPLACNAREAREMVDACREHGVLLMEAYAHRFHPQNAAVKKLLDEGRIGKVLGMTSVHSSGMPLTNDIRMSTELCGGVLGDKGCYCVNTARFLLGSEPISVFASVAYGSSSGVDERVSAFLEFPDEIKMQFDTSFLLDPEAYYQGYEVFGQSGRILVPNPIVQLETYVDGRIVDTSFTVTDDSGIERIDVKGAHQWQLEAEYFSDRVLDGGAIGQPAEDGLANMRAIDAIFASAAQERPVSPGSLPGG